MASMDIVPFALPHGPEDQVRFEEPRNITQVLVKFSGEAPPTIDLYYLKRSWPEIRFELCPDWDMASPAVYGWHNVDDQFNGHWQKAMTRCERIGRSTLKIGFQGLKKELRSFPDRDQYDVTFRRTLGIKVEHGQKDRIRKIEILTTSNVVRKRLRVELDAGKRTKGKQIGLSGYNVEIRKLIAGSGAKVAKNQVRLQAARKRFFFIDLRHMSSGVGPNQDSGHLSFGLDHETFTISLDALVCEGPIWFAEEGIFINHDEDPTCFTDYRRRNRGSCTITQRVLAEPEQSLRGAYHGQPRPHAVPYIVGCNGARQLFWIEPNGDLLLHAGNACRRAFEDKDRRTLSPKFKNDLDGRFSFDLDRWTVTARFTDPAPAIMCNLHRRWQDVTLEQKVFAVPLDRSILDDNLTAEDPVIAFVRFRFHNTGDRPAEARLPVAYSHRSQRSHNRLIARCYNRLREQVKYGSTIDQDDHLVPNVPRDPLSATDGLIRSTWHDEQVVRCAFETNMQAGEPGESVVFAKHLQPGETCGLVLKVPYIELEDDQINVLASLDHNRCAKQVAQFWRKQRTRGAQIKTPEPWLNDLYAAHLAHQMLADHVLSDGSGLINTSVGASSYGNFANESCMSIQELTQRGLHAEARRRLEVYLRFQSTAKLKGNFTDFDGVYFGAGGFEGNTAYCQNHGWVLWALAEHYFVTRDSRWLAEVAHSVIRGIDWVIRQRQTTMKELPFSQGWEYGFFPAGGVEDLDEYAYWLTTNALTWRGVDAAARALEAIDHKEAARLRREANAFRQDLIRGFRISRQQAPLVRLRDGRWVPHHPCRLYKRGRDRRWIAEVLEGSLYLILSGLIGANSRDARWILDDLQDNLYMNPPSGYPITDYESQWFDRGGFSIQPNLLAGLIPHLDRDEIDVYLWMFFNGFAACYREEINSFSEHPLPELGFSSAASMKTSDESNAMLWLVYMFVYEHDETLHLGRAIPRAWLEAGQEIHVERVSTRYGSVGVRYQSNGGHIHVSVNLDLHELPKRTSVRIRHSQARPIKQIRISGKRHSMFDPIKGDIDISGMKGDLEIDATY